MTAAAGLAIARCDKCDADTLRDYIRAGLVLVPIPAGSKAPHGKCWNLRMRCWAEPGHVPGTYTGNVGLAHAYSGTCALDIDNADLATPALSAYGIDLAALLAAPNGVHIRSGRPGRDKLLFRLRDPLASINRSAAEGFELRCAAKNGRTVQDVLPPSIHPDTGQPYQWQGDWRMLPDIPADLLALWHRLLPSARKERGDTQPATVTRLPSERKRRTLPDVIPEGERNAKLFSLARGFVQRGHGLHAVNDRLQRINADRCKPPLGATEVDTIAARAFAYGSEGYRILSDALFDGLTRSGLALPARWMVLTVLRRFDGFDARNITLTQDDCHDIPGCRKRKHFTRYRREAVAAGFLEVVKQAKMTRNGRDPTRYAIPPHFLPSLRGQKVPIAHGGQKVPTYIDKQCR